MAMSSQFKFVALLGSGGFGQVFKAKHKLDKREYAIKRSQIARRNEDSVIRALQEVELLAGLRHENVVGYNTTWIEHEDNRECSSLCQNTESQKSSIASASPLHARRAEDIPSLDESWKLSADFIKKLNIEAVETESSTDGKEDASNKKDKDAADTSTSSVEGASIGDFLYIQMELCIMTLAEFIDQGMNKNHARTWELFGGIVNGLEYIHGKNIIHRDMKPSNCLIGQDDQIKISDFGLSCTDSGANSKSAYPRCISRTGGIGTFGYLAPELLRGERPRYTEKVDIYSLGIVLADMMTFSCLECRSLVNDTKRGIEPCDSPQWCQKYGQVILLSRLINKNPLKRPNCEEIVSIISQVDDVNESNSLGRGTVLRSELQLKWRVSEGGEDDVGLPIQISAECKLTECDKSRKLLVLRKMPQQYTIQDYTPLWVARTSPKIVSTESPTRSVSMFIENSFLYIIIIWRSVFTLYFKYHIGKYSYDGIMLRKEHISVNETDRSTCAEGSLVYVTPNNPVLDNRIIYILNDKRSEIQGFVLNRDERSKKKVKRHKRRLVRNYIKISLLEGRENAGSKAITRDFAVIPDGNIITVNGTTSSFSVHVYNQYGQWEKCLFRHFGPILAPVPRICLDKEGMLYFVFGQNLFIYLGREYEEEVRFPVPGITSEWVHVAMIKSNGDIVLATPTELLILSNPAWRSRPASGSPPQSAGKFSFSPTVKVAINDDVHLQNIPQANPEPEPEP